MRTYPREAIPTHIIFPSPNYHDEPEEAVLWATACSVSFDRRNMRPSVPHDSNLKSTRTRATRHPQHDVGVWGSVTTNSRAEHSNEKCNVHKGERDSTMEPCEICPPIHLNFRSALSSPHFQHHEGSCRALAHCFRRLCTFPESV